MAGIAITYLPLILSPWCLESPDGTLGGLCKCGQCSLQAPRHHESLSLACPSPALHLTPAPNLSLIMPPWPPEISPLRAFLSSRTPWLPWKALKSPPVSHGWYSEAPPVALLRGLWVREVILANPGFLRPPTHPTQGGGETSHTRPCAYVPQSFPSRTGSDIPHEQLHLGVHCPLQHIEELTLGVPDMPSPSVYPLSNGAECPQQLQ